MGTLVSLLFPVAKTTDIRNTYARVCIIFVEQRKKKQSSSSAVRGTYLMYGPVVFAFIPKKKRPTTNTETIPGVVL